MLEIATAHLLNKYLSEIRDCRDEVKTSAKHHGKNKTKQKKKKNNKKNTISARKTLF